MFSRVLTDPQIQRIHEASLSILRRTGVVVPHADMLCRFADAGADVDHDKHRVRLPAELIANVVHTAGRQFTLYGRDLAKTASFGQGRRYYNSVAGEAYWVDDFGHMGISGVDQATSLDMLVFQSEVIRYVESVMRPLDLSDEALGLDLIDGLGPGGTFIDTPHTAKRFRHELWFPRILDRDYFQAWLDAGAASTEERCRRRKEEILATRHPEPLDPVADREIDSVVKAARQELNP